MTATINSPIDTLFSLLHGALVTSPDGINCKLKCDSGFRGRRPRLWAVPTEHGKRSEAYRAVRRELRDDWDFDLTDSENLMEWILAAKRSDECTAFLKSQGWI